MGVDNEHAPADDRDGTGRKNERAGVLYAGETDARGGSATDADRSVRTGIP